MGSLSSRFAVLAISLVVCSCGSLPGRPESVSSEKVPAGSALVLVSDTSFSGTCRGAGKEATIRAVDSGKVMKNLYLQDFLVKSDFGDHWGHVYAFILPAGEYAFWLLNYNPYVMYKDLHAGKSFFVASGETDYLGDLWVRGCRSFVAGFRNNWAASRSTFAQRYPGVNLAVVKMAIVENDPAGNDP